jgi:hypothetical protein
MFRVIRQERELVKSASGSRSEHSPSAGIKNRKPVALSEAQMSRGKSFLLIRCSEPTELRSAI